MGAQFIELLKRITIFMLAGQIILHFLPSGSYGKYVKMLIGVMLLSQIAVPVLSIGGRDISAGFTEALEQYEQQMERITSQVKDVKLAEADYAGEGLTEAVVQKLAHRAAEEGVAVTAAGMREDGCLTVYVTEDEQGSGTAEGKIHIEAVEAVSVGGDGREEKRKEGRTAETRTQNLSSVFAEELGMSREKLEVIWND